MLASYLRIAGIIKQYRRIIIAAIVVCVVNQLIFAIIISVSCIPVGLSSNAHFALGGTSIVLDLIIIALPLPVLWKLQLRLKQKVLLGCLFALGFFVTVIQIIRILTVWDLKTYTDSKNIVIWSCVEISLGVSGILLPLQVHFSGPRTN